MVAERDNQGTGQKGTGRTALVLTGGGARAAYQVGVLMAIAHLSPQRQKNPFPILCGTSAGAINAAGLACLADDFGKATAVLARIWRRMRASDIYRADALGIGLTGARWLSALAFGWLLHRAPRSFLDNSPLRELLQHHLDFAGIQRAIESGALHAVSVSASGYDSGENISFYQGHASAHPWRRTQRLGLPSELGVEHLMASSAIPFVFPAIHLHREYFGDGSMRQLAPISPAIHLGAERILIIGAGRAREAQSRQSSEGYPSLAQIAGHTLSSIFLDSLAVDIERVQRINQTLSKIPPEMRSAAGINLRPIETLVISPSERLDRIAAEYAHTLPTPVKLLLTGLGAMNRRGGALTSYLLFEKPYIRHLIHLGYNDALARRDEITAFLGYETAR